MVFGESQLNSVVNMANLNKNWLNPATMVGWLAWLSSRNLESYRFDFSFVL